MLNKHDSWVTSATLIPDQRQVVLLGNKPDAVDLFQKSQAEMSSANFAVIACESLSKATDYLAHHEADIIVADLDLPDSRGLETLNLLLTSVPDLPVVVLTESHDDQIGIEAVRMGAQSYIVIDEINSATICREIICAIYRFEREQDLRRQQSHLENTIEIQAAELHREIEQRALAEILREMLISLISPLEIDQIMEQILASIGKIVPHDTSNIMLVEGDEAYVAHCQGYPAEQEQEVRTYRFPLSINTLHQIRTTGQPYLVEDTASDPEWVSTDIPIRSYLGAPIKLWNQVIGFINLNSSTSGFFTHRDMERLTIFAAYAATALQTAQYVNNITAFASEMADSQGAVDSLYMNLSRTQSIAEFGYQIAKTALETFEVVDCGILLINNNKQEFERMTRAGRYTTKVLPPLHLDSPGLVPEAVREGKEIYVLDVTSDSRYVASIESTRSELVIPLRITGDKIIGVIDFQSDEIDAFSLLSTTTRFMSHGNQ